MGFTTAGGRFAHCTREEHAGILASDATGGAWRHRLDGLCACGVAHDGGASEGAGDSDASQRRHLQHDFRHDLRDGQEGGGGSPMRYEALPDQLASGHRLAALYPYHTATGDVAYEVRRYERPAEGGGSGHEHTHDKRFLQATPRVNGSWVMRLEAARVLYRLPELIATAPSDAPVVVCEGEKAVEAARAALRAAGIIWPVTTTAGGAKAGHLTPLDALAGRQVIILPDQDNEGERYAATIAERARAAGATAVVTLRLAGLAPKGDVADWLADAEAGQPGQVQHDGVDLGRQVETALAQADTQVEEASDATPQVHQGRGPSIAAQLVAEARMCAELFHDADGDAWASITTPGDGAIPPHHETWPLTSRVFARWLKRTHYVATGGHAPAQAVTEAIGALESFATFDGPLRAIHTRVAPDPEAPTMALYLDLGDSAWRAVHVTPSGWAVVEAPPVAFRRSRGMAPLPEPTPGGTLDTLRDFTNVRDDDAWRLVVAWLVAALHPVGPQPFPYPVLSLAGEQGAAKTTLARMLRALVDPNQAPVRAAPRDERDLAIAATNAWTLTLDNLDSVPLWLSNALCRLSTGGGFATRALYENTEETIFTAQRPAILTGIEEVATRGDLVDRSLLIHLEAIPDEKRLTERALWATYEAQRPALLGALLDAVAGALGDLPTVRLDGHPRMADFAEWATAAERALGWERGAFMRAYLANRRDANEITLDASPVASAVLALLDDADAAPGGQWEGAPAALLALLSERAGESLAHGPRWPKSPRGMTGALTRLAPNLRRANISITHSRASDARGSRIITLTHSASAQSGAEPAESEDSNGIPSDGCHDNHQKTAQPSEDRQKHKGRQEADARAPSDGSDGSDGWMQTPLSLATSPEDDTSNARDALTCPVTGGAHVTALLRTADGWLRCIECGATTIHRTSQQAEQRGGSGAHGPHDEVKR